MIGADGRRKIVTTAVTGCGTDGPSDGADRPYAARRNTRREKTLTDTDDTRSAGAYCILHIQVLL